MKYRVHVYATVRVEYEVEAESPSAAAIRVFESDLALHERFLGTDQEFVDHVDDVCLVDVLESEATPLRRARWNGEESEWMKVTQRLLKDGSYEMIAKPA